ncbi:type II secretion system F family protein [Bifidobacterium moukalabense]|uniref:type II secretion system F family protein n=1 Tax=Bifidobacterium moukalabense TaxID=1333651 RepID=UPI0010F44BFC|nr:type II secretion system F family protein [Bifidobacterium moukalabense]
MLEFWMIAAACCTAGAVWLWCWNPARLSSDDEVVSDPPIPLILEMLAVAIRQGASIPHALTAVGRIVGGDFGAGLASAGNALNQGADWSQAWPAGDDLALVRDAFASSWSNGASPLNRLDAAVEQLDWDERSRIEQSAAALSIRLLLPTGLCFLPAFVVVGVIPAIASFLG